MMFTTFHNVDVQRLSFLHVDLDNNMLSSGSFCQKVFERFCVLAGVHEPVPVRCYGKRPAKPIRTTDMARAARSKGVVHAIDRVRFEGTAV